MSSDASGRKLREHEKLLRRCASLEEAKRLVRSIVISPSESSNVLENVGSGPVAIYRLKHLGDAVFYIPGFLNHKEVCVLMKEILNSMIDSPPHSNSLISQESEHLWTDFMKPCKEPSLLSKLRWSCVGYHYDWGERSYDPTKKSAFPSSLTRYYGEVLRTINEAGPHSHTGVPESAIINFYHSSRQSDRLGGHRDDVESVDSSPLVSISLGIKGIFLIENEAIVLNSGDVLVMANDARRSLHGVPSVLPEKTIHDRKDTVLSEEYESDEDALIQRFLEATRVSISIRQVFSE